VQYLGDIDANGLFKVSTAQEQLQYLVLQGEVNARERYPACSHKFGRRLETTTTVMDLKGVSLSQFWKARGRILSRLWIAWTHRGSFYQVRGIMSDMMPITSVIIPFHLHGQHSFVLTAR
jgi:hypothetical protein